MVRLGLVRVIVVRCSHGNTASIIHNGMIEMKAKVIFYSEKEADVLVSDGGVATFHHNGEGILTTYYQERYIPEETTLKEDQTMWDFLGEGKSYCKEWPGQDKITDEMINDAVNWLCPMFEVSIRKIYQTTEL